MKDSKLAVAGIRNSAATVVYVAAVAWFMFNGNAIFGKQNDNFLMPLAILLLFVVSALITGLLVLGQPIWTYLQGRKAEAVKLLIWTAGSLAVETIIVFLALAL